MKHVCGQTQQKYRVVICVNLSMAPKATCTFQKCEWSISFSNDASTSVLLHFYEAIVSFVFVIAGEPKYSEKTFSRRIENARIWGSIFIHSVVRMGRISIHPRHETDRKARTEIRRRKFTRSQPKASSCRLDENAKSFRDPRAPTIPRAPIRQIVTDEWSIM